MLIRLSAVRLKTKGACATLADADRCFARDESMAQVRAGCRSLWARDVAAGAGLTEAFDFLRMAPVGVVGDASSPLPWRVALPSRPRKDTRRQCLGIPGFVLCRRPGNEHRGLQWLVVRRIV